MTTAANPTTPLTVLARASWSAESGPRPPDLPGFTASPFAPIIAHVADRCLGQRHHEPPLPAGQGESTAMVLVSRLGDMATEAAVTGSVDEGTKASPLLFYQSVPSAVLGLVSARWDLGGAVICVSPAGEPLTEAMDLARLLIEDGDTENVLLVLVELAVRDDRPDSAEALLVSAGEPA
ncbi:beta-ketoacyl synthase chain length factor [Streptomyces profundus]|uniref:beta-ketoacyl synthase chain length factor n=1 Tax=Streptomyces profundus TaxID=2867410 RepID=UPI001D162673|nr:beta-ketoacyl synthase chain length factor [Streptomyces sp. MA3_2.13]UED86266.1 beta-ketoacyl synthase chain length factor [Streptomyces sp. MA3_2.13]